MCLSACFTASAPKSLRSSWASEEEANPTATRQEEVWPALGDRTLVPMVEQLFSHLLKVINICAHVLDDVAPGPAIKVMASLQQLRQGSGTCCLAERFFLTCCPMRGRNIEGRNMRPGHVRGGLSVVTVVSEARMPPSVIGAYLHSAKI